VIRALVLGTALILASMSIASADENDADVACVFVGMRMSQSPDERTRSVSVGVIMYYIGKLDGQSPHLDLQSRLNVVQAHMTHDVLLSEARRCENQIEARGNAINLMGQGLATAQKPQTPQQP